MLVFLIGFMGAGKTTLGQALAAQLGYSCIDLDRVIECQVGSTIAELFAHKGERFFRNIEQKVLFETVEQLQTSKPYPQNAIIACGGGTPCFQQNLAFMKTNGFVIYLEVTPEILCERLLRTPIQARPLLPYRDPATLFHHVCHLLDQRKAYYEDAHWKC